jgi:hypothetical protein
MFEAIAQMLREMDAMFDDPQLNSRRKVHRAFEIAHRISDTLRPWQVQDDWKMIPGPRLLRRLGLYR